MQGTEDPGCRQVRRGFQRAEKLAGEEGGPQHGAHFGHHLFFLRFWFCKTLLNASARCSITVCRSAKHGTSWFSLLA